MSTHYENLQSFSGENFPPRIPGNDLISPTDEEHPDHYDWVDPNDHNKGKDPDKPLGPDGKPLKIIN
jgi:hypothetical protein